LPHVRPLDVDTGQQAIAGGISKLGEALFGVGQKLKEQDDFIELSKLKRMDEEKMFGDFQLFSLTSDPDNRKEVMDKSFADRENLYSFRGSQSVSNAFVAHRNNTSAKWLEQFALKDIELRQKNTMDSAKKEIDSNLELGTPESLLEAAKIYANLSSNNFITPTEAEQRVNELQITSKFVQARKLAPSDPQKAMDMMEQVDVKNLTERQIKLREEVINDIKFNMNVLGESGDKFIRYAVLERDKYRDRSLAEKNQKADEIIGNISKTLTGKALETEIEKTRLWVSGEAGERHPILESKYQSMVNNIGRGTVTKKQLETEVTNATRLPQSDPNALSDSEAASILNAADKEVKTSQSQALAGADEMAGRALVDYRTETDYTMAFMAAKGEEQKKLTDKRKLQFEILNQYNKEMRDFFIDNPTANQKEFEKFRDGKRYEYINNRAKLEESIATNIETYDPKVNLGRKQGESIVEYHKRVGR